MSYRNRCIIAGANGIITLSVPLANGRNQKTLMKDVKTDGTKWHGQHWKSIVSCYNKSPWFEFYKDELAALFSKEFTFLLDWDLACFEWTLKHLKLSTQISLTQSFEEKPEEGTTDFRNKILPKNYTDFEAIRYRQVFEDKIGFMPNLSILDLLFCEGKEAGGKLKG